MKRILVASDGSAGAGRAVAEAARIAHAFSAELYVLMVVPQGGNGDLEDFSRAERATVGDVIEARLAALAGVARAIAEKAGVPTANIETRFGDPAETILNFAKAHHVDAIVVGKRGHGRLKGLLLGSVSQKLVTLASCMIIVVP